MEYKVISLTEIIEWNKLLNRIPIEQQDIYYTPEYYKLYEEYGDGKAQCFIYEKEGEVVLYPFLLNSINELGFDFDHQYQDIQGVYGYNGPISSSFKLDFILDFNVAFRNYITNNNIIAEFTRFHPIIKNYNIRTDIEVLEDRRTVYLDISKNYDFIWNNCYTGTNRNMIRKALKKGISVMISNRYDEYISFFDMYTRTMHNIGSEKYYWFTEKYFKDFRTLLPFNHKLIIAKINNEIICAMLLMVKGRYAHYHLSGRMKEFSNTGVNNLILDEAIKISIETGCTYFHFGGGATNLADDQLLKFKSNFSKDSLMFYIGKKIHNEPVYNEVVKQWHNKYPEKSFKYKNHLLKYRY